MSEVVTEVVSSPLSAFLERIEEPPLWTVQFEEAERQTVLLGLMKLREARPGWEYVLQSIETKLGGQPFRFGGPQRRIPSPLGCFRCRRETPAAQLVATERGGLYCLSCIGGVEICRGCGCTEEVACPGGCGWASSGICSTCAPALGDSA